MSCENTPLIFSVSAIGASEATCIIRSVSFAGNWFARSVTERCPGADDALCAYGLIFYQTTSKQAVHRVMEKQLCGWRAPRKQVMLYLQLFRMVLTYPTTLL